MKENKSIKELVWGMAAYTSASIMGPLIIFGGFGYFLDRFFGKYPLWTLVFLALAFIFTNVLLFRKIRKLSAIMAEYGEEAKKKKEEEEKVKKELEKNNIEKEG